MNATTKQQDEQKTLEAESAESRGLTAKPDPGTNRLMSSEKEGTVAQKQPGDSAPQAPINVLIVGDWVLDEYWVLAAHHSDISSHTGFAHYRSDRKQNKILMDLCGAGHVARFLYHLQGKGKVRYRLFGLGKWHENHQGLITHLVHVRKMNDHLVRIDPYNQILPCCDQDGKVSITLNSLDQGGHTIRVIRQYRRKEGKLEQINRVDWEPQIERNTEKEYDLDKYKLPPKADIHAIIVHDLKKGVVTNTLIKALRERYPEALWYIRSKRRELISRDSDNKKSWIKLIPDGKLALLLIGPEVAGLLNPWAGWLAKGKKMTIQSLEVMGDLPGRNVVMLSAQHEVIARVLIPTKNEKGEFIDKNYCLTGKSNVKVDQLTELNWTSAFFGFLTHRLFSKPYMEEPDVYTLLENADQYSGLHLPEKGKIKPKDPKPNVENREEWDTEKEYWRQAMTDLGIIKDKRTYLGMIKEKIEVWRGRTNLPDYIVCIREKQEIINRIGRSLRAFEKNYKGQQRNLSILLQADPGAGKTSLAKSLAGAFGFEFLQFNITQMLHRDDLLDLFDYVATKQAEQRKPLMVFVDEINAYLENSHVYGAFLAPLEEGHYVRRGNIFRLRPCAWIFAGTNLQADLVDKGEKLSDFRSRMTMTLKIDFGALQSDEKFKEARLEQIYLGATMVHKFFPDIQYISREVLKQFQSLNPSEAPARKLLKWASSLQNVQYGIITKENCGSWEGTEWSNVEGDQEQIYIDF